MKTNGHEISPEEEQELLTMISDTPQEIAQEGLKIFVQTKM